MTGVYWLRILYSPPRERIITIEEVRNEEKKETGRLRIF